MKVSDGQQLTLIALLANFPVAFAAEELCEVLLHIVLAGKTRARGLLADTSATTY